MDYWDMIRQIAESGISVEDRGDMLIKDMAKVMDAVKQYKYTIEHYKGNGTVVQDMANKVKKTMVIMIVSGSVYAEILDIVDVC